ncbi:jg22779, partial [Pararge aegeria aegeria]
SALCLCNLVSAEGRSFGCRRRAEASRTPLNEFNTFVRKAITRRSHAAASPLEWRGSRDAASVFTVCTRLPNFVLPPPPNTSVHTTL